MSSSINMKDSNVNGGSPPPPIVPDANTNSMNGNEGEQESNETSQRTNAPSGDAGFHPFPPSFFADTIATERASVQGPFGAPVNIADTRRSGFTLPSVARPGFEAITQDEEESTETARLTDAPGRVSGFQPSRTPFSFGTSAVDPFSFGTSNATEPFSFGSSNVYSSVGTSNATEPFSFGTSAADSFTGTSITSNALEPFSVGTNNAEEPLSVGANSVDRASAQGPFGAPVGLVATQQRGEFTLGGVAPSAVNGSEGQEERNERPRRPTDPPGRAAGFPSSPASFSFGSNAVDRASVQGPFGAPVGLGATRRGEFTFGGFPLESVNGSEGQDESNDSRRHRNAPPGRAAGFSRPSPASFSVGTSNTTEPFSFGTSNVYSSVRTSNATEPFSVGANAGDRASVQGLFGAPVGIGATRRGEFTLPSVARPGSVHRVQQARPGGFTFAGVAPSAVNGSEGQEERSERPRRPTAPPGRAAGFPPSPASVAALLEIGGRRLRVQRMGLGAQEMQAEPGEYIIIPWAELDQEMSILRILIQLERMQQEFLGENEARIGPPPASAHTLQTLPASAHTLQSLAESTLTARDLLVPANRDCSICLGDYTVHDRVVRLPCAHRFCLECIRNWLADHCTCPDCRYELPTDNAAYERGRLERMALRPPRFARYELRMLFTEQLYELAGVDANRSRVFSRETLVDRIIESGNIALIPEEGEDEEGDAATAAAVPTSATMLYGQTLHSTVSMESSESADVDDPMEESTTAD